MSILCLWSPGWSIDVASLAELVPIILEEAPRVVVESRGVVWVDGKGLPAERLASRLLKRLAAVSPQPVQDPRKGRSRRWQVRETEASTTQNEARAAIETGRVEGLRIGLAAAPVVAEGAARFGGQPLTVVELTKERDFLAPFSLELLTDDQHLLALLEGSGIRNCGDLAGLTAEAVEVRFGHEGTRIWRLARANDPRVLFRPILPEKPCASVDFVDYTVRDATRLVFTLNALLDQVCGILRERSRRARSITLVLTLSSGATVREVLRTARPTADRGLWMRRLRAALERLKLPDTIAGVALEVESSDPISALQGDLFDRGFATASFVEEAVTRLLDLYRGLFVRQVNTPHALAERRVQWVDLTPQEIADSGAPGESGRRPALELLLLPEPRPIQVRTSARRDHTLPIRFREGTSWQDLTSAGPDRISGGHEETHPYAREYYRCVSEQGSLLWIYRDAIENRWYLHGWWD